MRRARVVITGDVQNVGFRSWTRHKADHFGLNGWVKNNPDGTAEAVFEGEDEKVNEIIEECKRGPPGSYVEGVEVFEEEWRGEFKNFNIVTQ